MGEVCEKGNYNQWTAFASKQRIEGEPLKLYDNERWDTAPIVVAKLLITRKWFPLKSAERAKGLGKKKSYNYRIL